MKIRWTNQAKLALRDIYDFYKSKSVRGAENVKSDLLEAPKAVVFSKQYQLDEINPKYRRIIVRDFKILYKEVDSEVFIMDIISTRQSTEILRKK